MRTIRIIVFCLILAPAYGQAPKQDVKADPLPAMKTEFEIGAESARNEFTEVMQDRIKEVAQSGDLDRVDSLVKQYQAFTKEARIPEDRDFLSAYRAYSREIERRLSVVREAYDQRIKDRTAQLAIDEAKQLRIARDAFDDDMREKFIDGPKSEREAGPNPRPSGGEEIDLSKIPGMNMKSSYDNPQLPYIYETWEYVMPPRRIEIKLIHATNGEAVIAHSPLLGDPYWYQIPITNDGYFTLVGQVYEGRSRNEKQWAMFVLKRHRR